MSSGHPRLRGRAAGFLAGAIVLGASAWAATVPRDEAELPPPAPAAIVALVDAGRFHEADAAIDQAFHAPGITPAQRVALTFERERMRRIRLDFNKSEADVRKQLRDNIPDLRDDEFAAWDRSDLLEHMTIDGEKRYFSRAASNLYRLSPEAVARRKAPPQFGDGPLQVAHPHHMQVRAAALASGKSSVLPQRFRITQSLTVEAGAVPAGEMVRAWVPYPREIAGQQDDLKFVASTPSAHVVAPASALQRTVYLEAPAVQGQPTKFEIQYDVTISAQYHAIDAAKVAPLTGAQRKDLAPYLSERAPHIVYTDALRALSRETVGNETNPYRIAQKLYRLVDDKFPWAGAREYSTIPNISDYTLHAHHGDCGQETLLLITLLRLNGIPARWQSGMMFSPTDYWNLHDWGQVYLAPYGWMPIDVTFGRMAGNPDIEWLYLGGLDGYRVAFNDEWGVPFFAPGSPQAKHSFRSETVDSQRGEAEWRGGNLYFNQFDYDFKWTLLREGT